MNGSQDGLFDLDGVKASFATLNACYAKAGVPEHCRTRLYDSPHQFNAEMQAEAWAWLERSRLSQPTGYGLRARGLRAQRPMRREGRLPNDQGRLVFTDSVFCSTSLPNRWWMASAGSSGTSTGTTSGGMLMVGVGRSVRPVNSGSHWRCASSISVAISRISPQGAHGGGQRVERERVDDVLRIAGQRGLGA